MMTLVHRSAARRAYDGARAAIIPAYGAGAIVGLLTDVPIMLCAGMGAMLSLALGAMRGLSRPDIDSP